MPFTIHKTTQPFVTFRLGYGRIDLPEDKPIADSLPPPVIKKKNKERMKMAEEKKLGHETGVEKISQEPADKQGPIGTGSPERQPAGPSEDVKIGNQEDKDNGKE